MTCLSEGIARSTRSYDVDVSLTFHKRRTFTALPSCDDQYLTYLEEKYVGGQVLERQLQLLEAVVDRYLDSDGRFACYRHVGGHVVLYVQPCRCRDVSPKAGRLIDTITSRSGRSLQINCWDIHTGESGIRWERILHSSER